MSSVIFVGRERFAVDGTEIVESGEPKEMGGSTYLWTFSTTPIIQFLSIAVFSLASFICFAFRASYGVFFKIRHQPDAKNEHKTNITTTFVDSVVRVHASFHTAYRTNTDEIA